MGNPNEAVYLKANTLRSPADVHREFTAYIKTELRDSCPCWVLVSPQSSSQEKVESNGGKAGRTRRNPSRPTRRPTL